jgi:hypothetical protein
MHRILNLKQILLPFFLAFLVGCDSQNSRNESATPKDPLTELRASIIGTWYGKNEMDFHYIYTFSKNGTVEMKMIVLGEACTLLEGPQRYTVYFAESTDEYGDKLKRPVIEISTGGVPLILSIDDNGSVLRGISNANSSEEYRKYKW